MTTKKTKSVAASAVKTLHATRDIKPLTRLLLAVRAGGRCEFDGHNKYLFRHSLTLSEGNFSQAAHIVAFSSMGPRGRAKKLPKGEINSVDNLMLLCPECHKLIDDHPERYSVSTLKSFKRRHEKRIHELTAMHPEHTTTAVVLKANIGTRTVDISLPQIQEAVAPRYVDSQEPCMIDLTALTDTGKTNFYETAAAAIDEKIARLYQNRVDGSRIAHLSVFALAPIPLLMHFGNRLTDKIPADLYQRHRSPETWKWKKTGTPASFVVRRKTEGADSSKVALVLSLSGTIHDASLNPHVTGEFSVYEITLDGAVPNPNFLRLRDDLMAFENVYQHALRLIAKNHHGLTEIHVFPAVPAPVAVACGRAVLKKVDPLLIIYDFDKAAGGFRPILRINEP